ncbi:transcriptional repressor general negative regulator of transcription subunit 4 [Quaeritorhiza haematococci]|nr:transcriptional repressor general negative regulator of transcription subunit 4 [Quaeritorhiza haematococci]
MASFSEDEEDFVCPLCMEEIDITDKYFKPCPCQYQICRFCWNHIKENLNGLCPACRRPYSEETVEFKPVSAEELTRIKAAKKKKEREKKEQEISARRQLANVRVVQKNLVYVLGLPVKVANEEILRQHDYFGQYGKISKIVVSRRGHGHTPAIPNVSNSGVYITFARKEDASKAIEAVDGSICDGRMIRAKPARSYSGVSNASVGSSSSANPSPTPPEDHELPAPVKDGSGSSTPTPVKKKKTLKIVSITSAASSSSSGTSTTSTSSGKAATSSTTAASTSPNQDTQAASASGGASSAAPTQPASGDEEQVYGSSALDDGSAPVKVSPKDIAGRREKDETVIVGSPTKSHATRPSSAGTDHSSTSTSSNGVVVSSASASAGSSTMSAISLKVGVASSTTPVLTPSALSMDALTSSKLPLLTSAEQHQQQQDAADLVAAGLYRLQLRYNGPFDPFADESPGGGAIVPASAYANSSVGGGLGLGGPVGFDGDLINQPQQFELSAGGRMDGGMDGVGRVMGMGLGASAAAASGFRFDPFRDEAVVSASMSRGLGGAGGLGGGMNARAITAAEDTGPAPGMGFEDANSMRSSRSRFERFFRDGVPVGADDDPAAGMYRNNVPQSLQQQQQLQQQQAATHLLASGRAPAGFPAGLGGQPSHSQHVMGLLGRGGAGGAGGANATDELLGQFLREAPMREHQMQMRALAMGGNGRGGAGSPLGPPPGRLAVGVGVDQVPFRDPAIMAVKMGGSTFGGDGGAVNGGAGGSGGGGASMLAEGRSRLKVFESVVNEGQHSHGHGSLAGSMGGMGMSMPQGGHGMMGSMGGGMGMNVPQGMGMGMGPINPPPGVGMGQLGMGGAGVGGGGAGAFVGNGEYYSRLRG